MNAQNSIPASGFFAGAPNAPLEKKEFTLAFPGAAEVVVKVAGCGLCHTDLGFLKGHVKTRHPFPLILGHEVSGTVIAAGRDFKSLEGKAVIVPAVLPCGECPLCKIGRDNICQNQKMPGNDFNGGFATHLTAPGRFVCVLPETLKGFPLPQLSVIADAVTTPYQSLLRSGLKTGDVAIVIGVGGIGIYMVQHARGAGATVIALDIDEKKCATACAQGAAHSLCVKGLDEKSIKDQVRAMIQTNHLPKHGWKIFETSGTVAGQSTAFSLLTFASTLGVIGFCIDKLPIRLSNIMAFDADMFGNWGCRPGYYPKVVDAVLAGKINVKDNVQEYPLDSINEVIGLAMAHQLERRAVLVP